MIELKIGGDLDNKKSRSEKEALLEQFAILSNTLPQNTKLNYFLQPPIIVLGRVSHGNKKGLGNFF